MNPKPETYPAIYIIFTLLNAIRRGIERRNIWREFRRQRIALKPRLSFWIALCRQAGLLDEYEGRLRILPYARRWLNKSTDEQAFHLIEAWQNAPRNRKVRQFRKKLLWKLKYDQPLTQKDKGSLNGLEALGLVIDGQLTKWGKFFIKGEGKLPAPKAVEPCKIQEEHFLASVPQHADLLWDIEKFLRPRSPGIYPLTKRALRSRSAQDHALHFYDGDLYELIELLERGLRGPMSEQTRAILLKQPSIRIADGIVLEFSSPAELKQLRRQPAFRKYIDEFLSPRCVLVSNEKAGGLFKMLTRRGVYAHWNQDQPIGKQKRTHFPQRQPALQPVGRQVPKLEIIEKYKQLGQALEMMYRVPGNPAERRRITPLLIEERGEHTYVIAYCHAAQRRAQRTFRLDRMEIPGTW